MNQRRRRKSTVNPDDLAVFAQPSDSEPGSNASNFAPESSLAWQAAAAASASSHSARVAASALRRRYFDDLVGAGEQGRRD